jgi:hypothetical protein
MKRIGREQIAIFAGRGAIKQLPLARREAEPMEFTEISKVRRNSTEFRNFRLTTGED